MAAMWNHAECYSSNGLELLLHMRGHQFRTAAGPALHLRSWDRKCHQPRASFADCVRWLWLLYKPTLTYWTPAGKSIFPRAGVGPLTSNTGCVTRLVVGRLLNSSFFLIHAPMFECISDTLFPAISTQPVTVAL